MLPSTSATQSRASSIHEAERQHGSLGELPTMPAPVRKGTRTLRTLSGRPGVQDAPLVNQPAEIPKYIPATFDPSDSPVLQRAKSHQSQVPGVGIFGGSAPEGEGSEYPPVRSEEELRAREFHRAQSRVQAQAGTPAADHAARNRRPSIVGAAATLATAGFGLGESDQQVLERTLSRVSSHKSFIRQPPPGRNRRPSNLPASTRPEITSIDDDRQSRQSGSELTVAETRDSGVVDPKSSKEGTIVEKDGGHPDTTVDIEKARTPATYPNEEHEEPDKDVTEEEVFMVRFEPGESANPKNWSRGYKWFLTIAASSLVLNSTFASSAPSGIAPQMVSHFHVSQEVATLMISLFVAGYCVGPLIWGPLSEFYGRRPVFIVSFTGYIGFQVGCALAPNTGSILVFRFLSGTFAACPLTNAGALLADIWNTDERGTAMSFYGLAPFSGPSVAPLISGFIQVSGTSWRWLYWVLCIFAGACGVLVLFGLPETYTPILLVKKAQILRKETGDDRYWAPLERRKVTAKGLLQDTVVKPFRILFSEPMLIAITVYMSFVYGCLYLTFEAYPIVFGAHGFNAGITGLMFLDLFVGASVSTALYIFVFEKRYRKKAAALAPEPVPPEARLEMTLLAAPLFSASFFWFGWTSYTSIHWASPLCAGGLLGFAIMAIFVSLFNYIVDTYMFAAASALAANTVCRSVLGASFPLFARQMFENLKPRWASSILGFAALIMVPIPFVLIAYGPKLRAKSKFSGK